MTHPLSRRGFLAAASFLGGAAILPQTSLSQDAAATPKPFRNPFIYRFQIGDIEAFSISDGHALIRPGVELMHPESDRAQMETVMKDNFERLDGIPLYINILVLRRGKEIAIFDAGFGKVTHDRFGWFFEALATLNIRREDVTHAFLSHAHVDHIAGFVIDDAIAFPNAALHFLKEESDFWFSKEPDFSQSKRNKDELPGLTRDNRRRFEILKPVTQYLKHGQSIWGGAITIEAAPGHSAGHAMFRIQDKGESLLHIMDLAHHHLLMFHNVNWTIAFDHNPVEAVVTRKKVYARASVEKTRLYGFHLPWPGLGHLREIQKDSFTWIPERCGWGS